MNKRFYARLAAQSIRKNGKFYKPYLLSVVGTVAAFYMMCATTDPQGVLALNNGSFATLETILNMGVAVVGMVSAAFLLYANSFLAKQRGREFGLYAILGMSKKNITQMLLWETVYVALAGLGGGLVTGIVFNKLVLLLLCRFTGLSVEGPFVYTRCAGITAVVFMAFLVVIFLVNSGRVHLSQPIALFQSRAAGEREPKARWLLALIGLGCLGTGYYIALATTSPLQALLLFFVAVLLVIAGTFLLFLAGAVTILKLLRKNKRYYYKTRHFVAVSGLMYRMKRNAAGLSIICILSTAVLVMLSTTSSLYSGMNDMLSAAYPWDVQIYCSTDDPENYTPDMDSVTDYVKDQGYHPENVVGYRLLAVGALAVDGGFSTELIALNYGWEMDDVKEIYLVPVSDYSEVLGQEIDLAEGEVIIQGYEDQGRYEIMQKVGMSQREITQSIRSQVLLVFFLPLGTAVLHTAVACPMLLRMTKALYLANTSLFLIWTAVSVAVFAAVYSVVYTITAKTYYRIVSPGGV